MLYEKDRGDEGKVLQDIRAVQLVEDFIEKRNTGYDALKEIFDQRWSGWGKGEKCIYNKSMIYEKSKQRQYLSQMHLKQAAKYFNMMQHRMTQCIKQTSTSSTKKLPLSLPLPLFSYKKTKSIPRPTGLFPKSLASPAFSPTTKPP